MSLPITASSGRNLCWSIVSSSWLACSQMAFVRDVVDGFVAAKG